MNLIHEFLNWLSPYRPEDHCIALPETEKPEQPTRKTEAEVRGNSEVRITSKTHQVFTVDAETNEWNNRAFETRTDGMKAEPYLTDADIAELKERGLWTDTNRTKAENIKPLFAAGRSRSEIVEAFKGTRGYADGSIWPLLAAFAASMEKAAQTCAE